MASYIPSWFFIYICFFTSLCLADDPFVNYDFVVSYITASPLGIPQQVRLQISFLLYLL